MPKRTRSGQGRPPSAEQPVADPPSGPVDLADPRYRAFVVYPPDTSTEGLVECVLGPEWSYEPFLALPIEQQPSVPCIQREIGGYFEVWTPDEDLVALGYDSCYVNDNGAGEQMAFNGVASTMVLGPSAYGLIDLYGPAVFVREVQPGSEEE